MFNKGIKSDIISGNNKTTQLPPALGPKQGNENNNSVIQQARTGVQARFEYAYGNYWKKLLAEFLYKLILGTPLFKIRFEFGIPMNWATA